MKRLKGPELKFPPSLRDVYYDMRDRRLLPLVALVVVAIAAVPFLLGDAEEVTPPSAPSGGTAMGGAAETSTLTVVEARPGLRDYRKRLGRHTPTDPFKQRYTGLPKEAQLSSEISSETGSGEAEPSSGVSVTADETATSPGSAPGSSPSGSERRNPPDSLEGRSLFGFRPDVRFGVAGSGQLALHEELPLGSLLPKQNAVVLFVGVTQNGERALFSVAPDVAVQGDGGCVGGAENCRFLSMRVGDAVDLLTASGKSFRLKVETIEFVELDVPPKAEQASGSAASESKRGLAPGLRVVGQFGIGPTRR